MSRSLLIRGRELESSYIFSGWVGVWYGGLEADECFSKNEIISWPLLGCVYFGNFIDVPSIYDTFVL
jgi:hypothetical protein